MNLLLVVLFNSFALSTAFMYGNTTVCNKMEKEPGQSRIKCILFCEAKKFNWGDCVLLRNLTKFTSDKFVVSKNVSHPHCNCTYEMPTTTTKLPGSSTTPEPTDFTDENSEITNTTEPETEGSTTVWYRKKSTAVLQSTTAETSTEGSDTSTTASRESQPTTSIPKPSSTNPTTSNPSPKNSSKPDPQPKISDQAIHEGDSFYNPYKDLHL